MSEGWHNRFRLVGKHHLDIYTAIGEIQKEQGYAEICINELVMRNRVKAAHTKIWKVLQRHLESIVTEYNTRLRLAYLRSIAANVNVS